MATQFIDGDSSQFTEIKTQIQNPIYTKAPSSNSSQQTSWWALYNLASPNPLAKLCLQVSCLACLHTGTQDKSMCMQYGCLICIFYFTNLYITWHYSSIQNELSWQFCYYLKFATGLYYGSYCLKQFCNARVFPNLRKIHISKQTVLKGAFKVSKGAL